MQEISELTEHLSKMNDFRRPSFQVVAPFAEMPAMKIGLFAHLV
jgi:hypothetical protein